MLILVNIGIMFKVNLVFQAGFKLLKPVYIRDGKNDAAGLHVMLKTFKERKEDNAP